MAAEHKGRQDERLRTVARANLPGFTDQNQQFSQSEN
jgi:hypothetical protein